MTALQTDPNHVLRDNLERLETSLATPIVGGELVNWIHDVQDVWAAGSAEVARHSQELHPRQYAEISDVDTELLPKVEKLKAEDAEIDKDRQELDRHIRRIAEFAPTFEPDEEKIREHTTALLEEGVAFINRVRKQEVALQTWFTEAFTRDRGVAD